MGATGVPVCGDPGWERRQPGRRRAVEYGRDAYRRRCWARAGAGPRRCAFSGFGAALAAGDKRVLWYARVGAHFALSMNPDYRYEGGRFGQDADPRALPPGDEKSWGGGVGVQRTAIALDWLGPALRAVRVAADHQPPPHRRRRHRVPDDDHGRLGEPGPHRPRAGAQLHHGHPREQRVARGVARRGLHQLPGGLVRRVGGPGPGFDTRDGDRTCCCWTSTGAPSR